MSIATFRARSVLPAAGVEQLPDAAVVVQDGVIAEVAPWGSIEPRGEVVPVEGLLVPGFVDAHSHFRGVSLSAHGIPPRAFESWICSLAAATPLDAGDEALIAGADLLETGVTSVQGFVDCAADGDPVGAARAVVAGVAATGLRALVMLSIADRALRTPEPAIGDWALVDSGGSTLDHSRIPEIVEEWLSTPSTPLVGLGIGPTGAQWASDGLLDHLAGIGTGRLHTHLHESRLHRTWLSGEASPLDRLYSRGLVTERLSAAHAVHLTNSELDCIASSGTALVHCPMSNEALQVGTARVRAWRERGIPAALGVDSQNDGAPDYFEVMRAAIRVAQAHGDPLTSEDVFEMATMGGAAALGINNGGRIVPGAPADFMELALDAETVEDIVRDGSPEAVRRVWVVGRLVVDEGKSIVDTAAARARLRTALDADAAARELRVEQQAATLELVDRLAGGM